MTTAAMSTSRRCFLGKVAGASLGASSIGLAADALADWPSNRKAVPNAAARSGPVLAAVKSGTRIVAVGDHGVVLLSEDGEHFRQAREVPVRSTLTTVFFVDRDIGWAAGHDGVVIHTMDGGETWKLLRSEFGSERPILSIHFVDRFHGYAVGLFGMALETFDGGVAWKSVKLPDAIADRHLYRILRSSRETVLILGEGGTVLRSDVPGRGWSAGSVGENVSLWCGVAAGEVLLAAGLRGHLYRSVDDGLTWKSLPTESTQSFADVVVGPKSEIYVLGVGGAVLRGDDRGRQFTALPMPDERPFTAGVNGPKGLLLFSLRGAPSP